MYKTRGFTLIEVMVVLVISVILVTMAIPSFKSLLQENRLMAVSNTIKNDILFARNQSISYLNYVTVCPLKNNACSDNWEDGMDIFIDSGTRGTFDDDDVLLKKGEQFNSADTLVYPAASITFTPDGQITGSSEIFRYCTDADRVGVSVAYSGRAKIVSSDAFSDCS